MGETLGLATGSAVTTVIAL